MTHPLLIVRPGDGVTLANAQFGRTEVVLLDHHRVLGRRDDTREPCCEERAREQPVKRSGFHPLPPSRDEISIANKKRKPRPCLPGLPLSGVPSATANGGPCAITAWLPSRDHRRRCPACSRATPDGSDRRRCRHEWRSRSCKP